MAKNHAIAIGINQYELFQPLNYAKADALSVREFLQQEAEFEQVLLFTDDSPSVRGIPTRPSRSYLRRWLSNIFSQPFLGDGDNFWFFFSGHGMREGERDYLMPIDGDPEDVAGSGIAVDDVIEWLRRSGADNVVLILDACRNRASKSGVGVGVQTAQHVRQRGVVTIFSCSPNQFSYEIDAIRQGAFTKALLEGLGIQGNCATVERLNQYLEHRVPEIVNTYYGNARQVPYTIAEPINKAHLILMPKHTTLQDVAILKLDAYSAEAQKDFTLAKQLWIRVLAVSRGDSDAIAAIERLARERLEPNRHEQVVRSKANQQTISQNQTENLPLQVAKSNHTPLWETDSSYQSQSIRSARNITSNLVNEVNQIIYNLIRQRAFMAFLLIGIIIFTIPQVSRHISNSNPPSIPHSIPDGVYSPKDKPLPESIYSALTEYLQVQDWKAASQETRGLMLKAVNKEFLDDKSISEFPCEVLKKLDQLWVESSGSQFGFSVQTKIYEECGGIADGKLNSQAWACFGDRVGWRVNNEWIKDYEGLFNTANRGQFPVGDGPNGAYRFFPRVKDCRVS